MSLNQSTANPGTFDPADANNPFGTPRDVSGPGNQDGCPWNANVFGDWYGFYSSILTVGGESPNGSVDDVGNQQILNTLAAILPQRESIIIPSHQPAFQGDNISNTAIMPPDPFATRNRTILNIYINAQQWADFDLVDDNSDVVAQFRIATQGASPNMVLVVPSKATPLGKVRISEIDQDGNVFQGFGLYVTYKYVTP